MARVESGGKLSIVSYGPGDQIVLRSSALMDERMGELRLSRLISPIAWHQVVFLFTDHKGLTEDPAFSDNLLFLLLEKPKFQQTGL
jgi:hypothetical protein